MRNQPFDAKKIISGLPFAPGIYKFLNAEGQVIYIGKAKDLKKRVSSYFNKLNDLNNKTKRLVSQVNGIEYTVTDTEYDALLLENTLIKEHQPRYNIMLRDDKSYPFICITAERFPRIFTTRKTNLKGEYFGPYVSVKALGATLDLIGNLFTVRNCKLNLSEKNITAGKFSVCLEFHLGNCKGPCAGRQSEEDYNKDIDRVRQLLKGKVSIVKTQFKTLMTAAAEKLNFEEAESYKNKLELIERFRQKSTVVNTKITDTDVYSITSDEKRAFVNYLHITDGSIVRTKTSVYVKKLDESDEEILLAAVVDIRATYNSSAEKVLTNIPLTLPIENTEATVPLRGEKQKLLKLSLANALAYKKSYYEITTAKKPHEQRILETLQKDLHLRELPVHIECFDNSNFQGSAPAASTVCFKNGRPSKKDYRHYHVKEVEGPDDFASMREIVGRRYKRLSEENQPMPDLIIIDGGKGQLSAAVDALKKLNLGKKIPVIGIAKRLEEIYVPGDSFPLHIDKKSESLKLIQRIRDEAHRFALAFHQNIRSKESLILSPEGIKGIGSDSINKLYKKFKTLKGITNASEEDLIAAVGKKRAELIITAFQKR